MGFLRAKFRRGYSRSRWPELFREDARCNMTTESSKTLSMRDVFEVQLKGMRIGRNEIQYPSHLQQFIDYLERAMLEDVEIVIAAPPRHGKTFCSVAAFIFYHLTNPGLSHKYVTYSGNFATHAKRILINQLTYAKIPHESVGGRVIIFGSGAVSQNTEVSFGGYKTLTGTDCSGVILFDDIIKSYEDATSLTIRDKIWNEIDTGAFTRKQQRMSIIAMGTRWHQDDPQGRLIDIRGFKYVNLTAICEDTEDGTGRELGAPLCESLVHLETLLRERDKSPHKFAAMYMGDPRLGTEKLFANLLEHDVAYISNHSTKTAYGMDLAYSDADNKKADWNVCVRLVRDYTDDVDRVDAVLRMRCNYADFLPHAAKFISRRPGKVRWHPSGMERGATRPEVLRVIPNLDVSFVASKSKRLRASNVIERCKKGKLSTPREKTDEMIAFERCLDNFTGLGDIHDDDIDALASAESLLPKFNEPVGAVSERHHEDVRRTLSNRYKV